MIDNIDYKVNPLEKIEQIEDIKVRKLCEVAVKEAILMTERADSNAAISQKLNQTISMTSAQLAKED